MPDKPTDDMMQCPACHGQAPDFRCRYCEGVGGVTEDRFHAYHDKASADLDDVRAAVLDTLKKSAPGISEMMRVAICNIIVFKLRNPAKESGS